MLLSRMHPLIKDRVYLYNHERVKTSCKSILLREKGDRLLFLFKVYFWTQVTTLTRGDFMVKKKKERKTPKFNINL